MKKDNISRDCVQALRNSLTYTFRFGHKKNLVVAVVKLILRYCLLTLLFSKTTVMLDRVCKTLKENRRKTLKN